MMSWTWSWRTFTLKRRRICFSNDVMDLVVAHFHTEKKETPSNDGWIG